MMMESFLRYLASWGGLRCLVGACPWKVDAHQGAMGFVFQRCATCGDTRWRRI